MSEETSKTIFITVHFIDGQIWTDTLYNHAVFKQTNEEFSKETIGRLIEHKSWYDMGENTFLPASRIAKVVWKELATPPEKE